MRPSTLSETIERVHGGEPLEIAFPEFVDVFVAARRDDARYAAITDEPQVTGNRRLDALAGATAEYLAKRYRIGRVPSWVNGPARRLDEPWFTTMAPTRAMCEYLTFSSPAEFRARNIFTEERPFRRAGSNIEAI
jgi:hypothetical protein